MAEKVMIPRENRPLLVPFHGGGGGREENSSHIYSPFPAGDRFRRRIWEAPILECPLSLSLGGDHGIYGEWGTHKRDENLNLAGLPLSLHLGRWRSSQPIAFDYGMYVALHYPLLHGLKVDQGTAVL